QGKKSQGLRYPSTLDKRHSVCSAVIDDSVEDMQPEYGGDLESWALSNNHS
ncbi:hypothetical protein STEG23_015759, partial [Scotinomys teguina]